VALLGTSGDAVAQAFTMDLTVGGVTETRTFRDVESALSLLQGNGIRSVFPGYTSGTPLTANVNLAGLTVPISVPSGTTTAIIAVPGTNRAVAFQGQTGAQTQTLLRDYFRGTAASGDPISSLPADVRAQLPIDVQNSVRASLTNILQAAVARTVYDPIAGNPTALLPTMAASDFSAGTFPAFGNIPGIGERREQGFTFSLGLTGATTTRGNLDVSSITVPVRVGYNFGATGTEVFLDGSFSGYDTDGTRYYQGTVGIGVRQRILASAAFDCT
jgi:hypothetical protein